MSLARGSLGLTRILPLCPSFFHGIKRWIKQIGQPAPSDSPHPGKYTCKFGPLFEAVKDDMQAVSSTLRTARRLGVVTYEGEHLLQGSGDDVSIYLLEEEETQRDVVVSDRGSGQTDVERDPFAIDSKTSQIVPCWRCGKDVFPADRVGVDGGRVLHRACFECWLDTCTVQLTPSRYAGIVVDGQWRFYCIPHYKQLFTVGADYEKGFAMAEKNGAVVVGDDQAVGDKAVEATKMKPVEPPRKTEEKPAEAKKEESKAVEDRVEPLKEEPKTVEPKKEEAPVEPTKDKADEAPSSPKHAPPPKPPKPKDLSAESAPPAPSSSSS